MVLKLYGNLMSTCTTRVMTVLHEKQVDFEFVKVDFATGEHKSPAYVAKQPFGQVPYLDDDGFLLYESRAMSQYLAVKYRDQGTELYPADGDVKGLARLQQGISIEMSNFDPIVREIAWERIYKAFTGNGSADETRVAKYVADLEGKLAVYEGILSKQKYLTGDKISLADLFHLPSGSVGEKAGCGEVFAKYPAFYKWFKELQDRDSWKEVNSGKY